MSISAVLVEPLKWGRLKSPQPMPYVEADIKLEKRELTGTGGTWHDYRRVTFKIRGLKADVINVAAQVQAVFNLQTVLTYPSTSPATGLPRFIRWWPQGDLVLSQDPATKDGQDIWLGTLEAIVWSIRAK